MKIAVIVDSGCGISKDAVEKQGIFYLPLQINDKKKQYLDGIDLISEEIIEKLKNDEELSTSLPPLGVMEEVLTEIKNQGYDQVVSVTLSSGLSSTMDNLVMMAKELELEILPIETWTTCYLQYYIALQAKKLVDRGYDLSQIKDSLNDQIQTSNTYILPTNLDRLKKGGRLTPLAASMANLLKIKPILSLNKESNGRIDTLDKVRTTSRAIQKMVAKLDGIVDDNYLLIICGTIDSKGAIMETKKLLEEKYPNNDLVIESIAPVISVHTGLECVGIQYIKKVDD